ncbi:MAG: cyclase family protein [Vicinamibacterales bacterium]
MTIRTTTVGTLGLTLLLLGGPGGGRPAAQVVARQSAAQEVTKAQFDRWMTELSNWGRWGMDDERGALNLITDATRRAAAALVRTGTAVSLSRPIRRGSPTAAQEPRPVNTSGAFTSRFLIQGDYLFERQELEYHGTTLSHFDALCHVSYNGRNYNNFLFRDIVTPDGGCSRLSVDAARDGIVTRGVLVDLPGVAVGPAEMTAWEKSTGIRIQAGDALLLRTRRSTQSGDRAPGGYSPSLIPFFKERDIALLGSDIPQEGGTVPGVAIPIHVFTLVALGVHLLDNLALDELAATAERLKRWEFMLSIQPVRAERGAGGPVNPVAIF